MTSKAPPQSPFSLDINPDEIEDEKYAKIIRELLFIIDKQNGALEFLRGCLNIHISVF